MINVDYLIVGSGLTGAVIARALADAGREVLVVDRRSHMGGNVHDHAHPSGIRIHTYGPHYFRTSSDRIWEFVNRFSPFYRYEAALLSEVEGELAQWPIAGSFIKKLVGERWEPEFKGQPANFEEAALGLMPRRVYELFIKEYNEKQWGVPSNTLAARLCTRFDVRLDDEPRLKPDCKHQGIPELGYAGLMEGMLRGIPVLLNFDYLKHRDSVRARRLTVFTGPIDEFFGFDLGRLHYRGQRRVHEYLPEVDRAQPCGQVNNPTHAGGPHIRTLEWKHMMRPDLAARIRGTVLTREITYSPDEPSAYEYPFPDDHNQRLYQRYRERADALANVLLCGRLGEYRYFDMDQAIARAMVLAERVLADASVVGNVDALPAV
ncbi:MAG: NAD(P)-binding protein [Deltaproteobacteria bacterium]|nr:NAD(P)-binding protein [Deltaproteobacteria bacterium]